MIEGGLSRKRWAPLMNEFTQITHAIKAGDHDAAAQLLPRMYDE